jgi:UDP-3-O-[3-hydroxymyristoyl] N-acetylglucosamine deacetylase
MNSDYFGSPQGYRIQKTIRRAVTLEGVGLHTGQQTRVKLVPAGPNHGIVFERQDLERPARIFAHYDAVVATEMATTLGYRDWPEARVSTVEHLLAALFAIGITNLTIEVTGSEIPVLDGSAGPFVDAILDAGVVLQPFSHAVLRILKPVKVYQNGAICELLPRDRLRLTTSIDFAHPAIGLQTFALELTPRTFKEQIGAARTFGFLRDVERLKGMQLALGASLDNVLAFSEREVLNPGGARFADECVRHKLLDAIGDLALCGCWIEGELVSFRGGHSIHLALLKALREHRSNWEILPPEPLSARSYSEETAPVELALDGQTGPEIAVYN